MPIARAPEPREENFAQITAPSIHNHKRHRTVEIRPEEVLKSVASSPSALGCAHNAVEEAHELEIYVLHD